MQGLTLKSLRHHYALIPLFVIVGGGAVFASAYLLRLTQNLDATWNRRKNPYPWTRIKDDQQTKFISMTTEYKGRQHPRPTY